LGEKSLKSVTDPTGKKRKILYYQGKKQVEGIPRPEKASSKSVYFLTTLGEQKSAKSIRRTLSFPKKANELALFNFDNPSINLTISIRQQDYPRVFKFCQKIMVTDDQPSHYPH
jgi:hypothetical protein